MLQYFIELFQLNEGQCYNTLLTFLIKIKLLLQYFIELFWLIVP